MKVLAGRVPRRWQCGLSDGVIIRVNGMRRLGPAMRALLVALGTTGAATLPAFAGDAVPTSVAALAYVLAVTISAAKEGLRGGIAASLLSFPALNFFFTEPRLTFRVAKTEDVIALFAFLAVAGIVGTLLSAAVRQRARAERREREARLLHHVTTRLMSGDAVGSVLRRFAEAISDLLDLARCEIEIPVVSEPIVIERGPSALCDAEVFPMKAAGSERGRITVYANPAAEFGDGGREVIKAFAGQIALALERLRLTQEAQVAQIDAEESRLRAALFSSVTHDLRTPLASVTAAVTSLQDEQASFTPGDRKELLDTIRQEADRLNRLVGNLLNLARIRAGALTPQKKNASIEEVIEAVLARLQRILAGREVRLKMRGDLGETPMDVIQIDQVLTNLIENALKYSPEGSQISIVAARWRDDVEVRVADRGRGIPAEERQRVFEPFVRADDDPRAGSGLGLSIAQAVVVAHGGTMWIESTPGGGTTVAFRLPGREPQ
ncbi:MAG TPA: ATP-binding protein [Actinomycetota bacterium]